MRGSIRGMIALLSQSRVGSRHKRIDWTLVLAWAGTATALLIILLPAFVGGCREMTVRPPVRVQARGSLYCKR